MTKGKLTDRPGLEYCGPGKNPFDYIRLSLEDIARKYPEKTLAFVVTQFINKAEKCYLEGKQHEALLWVWDAGRMWAAYTEDKAPKIMRNKRKAPTASGKANVEAAWTKAFNTHKPFRRWDAHAQADYLAANYSKDVAGITPETLGKYVRAFRKKAQ